MKLVSTATDSAGALATYTARASVSRSDATSDFFALIGNLTMDGRPIAMAVSARSWSSDPAP